MVEKLCRNQQFVSAARLWPESGPTFAVSTTKLKSRRSSCPSLLTPNGASSWENWGQVNRKHFTFTVLLLSRLTSRWEQVIYWDLIFLLFIQISIQPVFRQQPEMKRNLIPVLLKSKRITPDIITQYCRSTTASPTVSLFLPSFSSSFFCSEIHILLSPCCSAFGLDHSSVINQYILTLLLQEQSEQDVVGDLGAEQEEAEPLCHADALERVLQLLPMLRNSSELTDSLSASISKVSTPEGKPA